ncbi:hypothetical protein [Mycobacteroides abscessus]|uniref:hypothetical protein n=1 Tax=Mycobacteroides abscessus TaxID=36809 RepID=UPI0002F7AEC7|nr:hypothetical protein [Mycobacteroides abscessus]MDO2969867.1 hypothetical protein [Mycobacteroides abscessus subsp. bolletii]MDO3079868.1 hypothetical protein [Mycobacteroides abscessus subsp. bolletii]SKK68346.1 Uncharacterised protein [Mycobacteroides abscessus subsp. bolletii]
MGGTGGSEYRDSLGGAGAVGDGSSCDALIFESVVMSPDPEVVRQLALGTLCEIIVEGWPRQIAVYVRASGARLGAITDRWFELTNCVDTGYTYEAVVISTTVPVRVRIRPRAPYRLALPLEAIVVGITADLLNPAEGDQITLALSEDGRALAMIVDGEVLGAIPAEPIALPEAIRDRRALTATLDGYESDGTVARIIIGET